MDTGLLKDLFIGFAFCFLIMFFIGLPISVLVIDFRDTMLLHLGVSFPIGMGILTWLFYLTNLFGIRFSVYSLFFVFSITGILLFFLSYNHFISFLSGLWLVSKYYWKKEKSLQEYLLIFLIIFLCLASLVYTIYWPVYAWDSLALYDFRARSFAQSGYMSEAIESGYFWSYPLMTSVSHTLFYLLGIDNPQFIYTFFYISIIFSFGVLVSKYVPKELAIFFSLLLASIEILFEHSLFAYTNLPYTFYFSFGILFLWIWLVGENQDKKLLVLSFLLISLSTWVRSKETFWMLPFVFVFVKSLFSRIRKLRLLLENFLVSILVFFPIQQSWKIFQASGEGLSTSEEFLKYGKLITNLTDISIWKEVLPYVYDYAISSWGFLFWIFLSFFTLKLLLINSIDKKDVFLLDIIIFSLLFIVVIGTFLLSLTYPYWREIGNSLTRMVMFFYPLFVFDIAISFYRILKFFIHHDRK